MKIAHVLDTLSVGGAERVVLTLSALQIKQGHSVEVHYLFAGGSLETEFVRLGVGVYSATAPGTLKIIARLYRNFMTTKPDVAHFHNATAAIYGPLAALLAHVRARVSTRHGLVPPRGGWLRESKFWLAARLCFRAVAVSSQTERNMRAFPLSIPSKITLIVNGSFPAKSSSDEDAPKSDLFTFVHVARLTPVKNQARLVEAFVGAFQQNPRLRLILVGDGPLRGGLEQLAASLGVESNVIFAGERENIGNWFAVSNCFVLTSTTEGTPISLLEALAAALPCIVSNVGEMPAILDRCHCGLVVSPDSVQQLTAAMLQIASLGAERLATLSRNARREYEAQFQPEVMAECYLEIYRRALRASPVAGTLPPR
ncbi:MAG: glycosyltransferase [Acidobacteriaceae bacterium]